MGCIFQHSKTQMSSAIAIMKNKIIAVLILISLQLFAELCTFSASYTAQDSRLTIHADIAEKSYLYVEALSITLPEASKYTLIQTPSISKDEHGDSIYTGSIDFIYSINQPTLPIIISITFQGCSETMCYMPQTVTVSTDHQPSITAKDNTILSKDLQIIASNSGYINAKDFLEITEAAYNGELARQESPIERIFSRYGFWIVLIVMIILGMLLNLTPCVLPMIPINLAIILSGKQTRSNALFRGLLYGSGMAISYGCLGIITVFTGANFGAINASPVFNFAIAIVFILLGIAMLDIIQLDFSRFRSGRKYTGYAGIFIMGSVSAILASACVAPVLVWGLLLSIQLHTAGHAGAVAIPFALGIGMALPWPILATGIATLPKPGKWMLNIRRFFAILICGFAIYYVFIGIRLCSNTSHIKENWLDNMETAIVQAKAEAKPIFVEFTGTSCKSCDAMNATTFKNKQVRAALEKWICVEILTDDNKLPSNQKLASEYNVIGVPTCIWLSRPNAQ